MNKIFIIAAPSGSGKSSIVKQLLQASPRLKFSVSATTRSPRGEEKDGIDYYFITVDEFKKSIEDDAFIEWEMVYEGKYYGTLKSEIDRIYNQDNFPLLDIDVVGAVNLKRKYKDSVVSIFIKAPSLQVLEDRLRLRGTDSEEIIQERIAKAKYETDFEQYFDYSVINDELSLAVAEVIEIIESQLK